jgi:hypothetical protein
VVFGRATRIWRSQTVERLRTDVPSAHQLTSEDPEVRAWAEAIRREKLEEIAKVRSVWALPWSKKVLTFLAWLLPLVVTVTQYWV